ncbi:hypothetical protein FFI89_023270 [Bradyrhizobium sp. KBS0727]|uniref:hypothetical protein n=1 Tax=unclassified Bradyrhizobium TaxID=2631580 RepID=UPI00110F15E7|nr:MULTISPECIES: hypothetical protein [unclassified Bradyrhizobium]QDW39811.1 hypothetical protein FFI71_023275 [Bradyrhizobium sp. KBS0725]QDW46414.1 hypothetical protein FFI89_023270 [Bradyrhizobium sp. KBS0727]
MEDDFDWFLNRAALIFSCWKLVLTGSITLFTVGTASLLLLLPTTYSSHSVLPLSAHGKAILTTEVILDPVARKVNPPDEVLDVERRRQSLASAITLSSELNPGSGLYTLTFTDQSPTAAQAVLNNIVETILTASKPTGSARAEALQQLETLVKAKSDLEALATTLTGNTNRVKDGGEGELYARALAVLVSDIAAKKSKLWQLRNYLEGTSLEDVLVRPTLPNKPDPKGLLAKLLSLAIGSVGLMIFGAIFRHSWRQRRANRNVAKSPNSALSELRVA